MAVMAQTPVEQESELLITGSEAMAIACKMADVDVVTAFPIRPYDTVMQFMSQLIADGEMDCEFIPADGEHSQFEIVKHASTCGARVFVGSSGVGWMYAMEALTVTPALRVPMVAMVGNRALDDPGAFGIEHNDALSVRDLGWHLVWVDSAQEAFDTDLIAYRFAEDKRIMTPVAISLDGAFLTHSQSLVKIPTQAQVDKFLPTLRPRRLAVPSGQQNLDRPAVQRRLGDGDPSAAVRRHERSKDVMREVYADVDRIFGRNYGPNPFFEEYMTEDADVVLLGMGTLSMPVKVAIRKMRARGQEGRLRASALVPPVPGRGTGTVPRPLQGRGRHRPRLLAGFAVSQRRGGHRSAHRAVSGQRPEAAGSGVHLRSRRTRSLRTRYRKDDRRVLRGRSRQTAAADAMDRGAGVIPAPERMSEK